jgi:limonene-1,2-epoxide hydrolase
MMSPLQCVQKIYEAFHRLDIEAVYALLDEDVVYQNMAQQPLHGKQALRKMWSGFGHIDKLDLKILNMLAAGDVVLNERLDHLVLAGRDVYIAMAAAFVVKKGKVTSWREYYDMRSMELQLGKPHPGSKPA